MTERQLFIEEIEVEREALENNIKKVVKQIGPIQIGSKKVFPFGWRKAAKGRTVWRIIEEIISQNLEKYSTDLGFDSVTPADSEVGVWDFKFTYNGFKESYVNIKSSVLGGKRNKDDISKAEGLINFYEKNPNANVYVATFVIDFKENMTVEIVDTIIFPLAWIPDIYVNPSNNGNLQSSYYKDLRKAEKRTNNEFIHEFKQEVIRANEKRLSKIARK